MEAEVSMYIVQNVVSPRKLHGLSLVDLPDRPPHLRKAGRRLRGALVLLHLGIHLLEAELVGQAQPFGNQLMQQLQHRCESAAPP